MAHRRGWTNWVAAILIVGLIILAIWWAISSSQSCISGYTWLTQDFPDPTNRMCWCRPLPFQNFYCETLGLKRVCCDDFDLEGRRCYCCTADSPACKEKACSVPY